MFRQKKLISTGTLGIMFVLMILPLFLSISATSQTTPISSLDSPKSASTSDYTNVYFLNISRRIEIDSFGAVLIEDTYKIRNNNSYNILVIDICLSDEDIKDLVFHEAYDSSSGRMKTQILEEKLQGYTILEILLSEPLLPHSSKKISLKLLFRDMIVFSGQNSYYGIESELHPVCPYEIIEFTTSFYVPDGSQSLYGVPEIFLVGEPTDYDGTYQQYYGENIAPLSSNINRYSYQNENAGPVRISNLNRIISVNSLGYIRVIEQYTMISMGIKPVYVLEFQLPLDIENVRVYDDLGELGNGNNDDTGKVDGVQMGKDANDYGTIDMSLILYYNRASLNQGNTIKFSITYDLQAENYLSSKYGQYNLNLDTMTTKSNYLIEKLDTKVELLGVLNILDSNINEENMVKTGNSIIYQEKGIFISKYHQNHLDLTFRVNFILQMFRPIIFMILFAVCFSLYAIIKSRTQIGPGEESESRETIPISELTQFISLFEEKNALSIDIEKADSALIRRKIQKKAYTKTIKVLSSKLKELNEDIAPFKKLLLHSNTDVKFIIQKLDYLEAEKMSVKDSIIMLQDKYKKGKLPSKAAYEKLSTELLKRTSSSQKKIDRYVNELRAFTI